MVVDDYTALLSGGSVSGNGVTGTPVFLSYSFCDSVPDYQARHYSQAGLETFRPMTEYEKDTARAALKMWGDACGITFFEAASGQGDLNFGVYDTGALGTPSAGFAVLPGSMTALDSDIFLNPGALAQRADIDDLQLMQHEIGHALGFKHPFEGDVTLSPETDNQEHTVLSYTGASTGVLGEFDYQAAAYLYGAPGSDGTQIANWSYNNASRTLTQTGTAGADSIRGIGGKDVINAGGGDDIVKAAGGNDVVRGGEGNDSIASPFGNGQFFGEAGDDSLFASYGNALLDGGADNDTLSMLGGSATMLGGDGNDTFYFTLRGPDTSRDLLKADGGEGFDTLTIFADSLGQPPGVAFSLAERLAGWNLTGIENVRIDGSYSYGDRLIGSAGAEIINGQGGDDVLTGLAGNDSLGGGADDDQLFGGEGNDQLDGFTGDDMLVGGGGIDYHYGSDGYDTISFAGESVGVSASVNGQILTSAGEEFAFGIEALIGTSFVDALTGDAGDNRIAGGAGNDLLAGGGGADIFVFAPTGEGADTISDFAKLQDGFDLGGGFFAARQESGGDTILTYGGGTIRIEGVTGLSLAQWNARVSEKTLTANADTFAGGSKGGGISGLGGNDKLTGGAGDDRLHGGDGHDKLAGGIGRDLLDGGAGDDELDGGAGSDRMVGGEGEDSYRVDRDTDQLVELAGGGTDTAFVSVNYVLPDHVENLTVDGGTGFPLLGVGNALDNVMTGSAGWEKLDGGAGNDVLSGGGGYSDELAGGDGNDILYGDTTGAFDTLLGGKGDDIYIVTIGFDVVAEAVDAGYDILKTHRSTNLRENFEELQLVGNASAYGYGNELDNRIVGNAFDNQLHGEGGDDRLIGGGGNDQFYGGDGTDTASLADAAGGVVLDLNLTTTQANGIGGDIFLSGIENVIGTAFADQLTGSDQANTIEGAGGGDTLDGRGGIDTVSYASAGAAVKVNLGNSGAQNTGGAGTDTLTGFENVTGSAYRDTLTGTGGANVVDGGRGADTMNGGGGDDTYLVDSANDKVIEGSAAGGVDSVISTATFTLGANLEKLILAGAAAVAGTGNSLANVITGNSAANVLNGGVGADTMNGAAGNDTYVVDSGGDKVMEGAGGGVDSVRSSVGYTLGANLENLVLTGSGAAGTGNGLANALTGNAAANALGGGGGNDMLDGGAGADTMNGAGGSDTYIVDNVGDKAIESSAAGGTDLVRSSVGFTLGANVENLTLTGTGAVKGVGNGLANTILGNGGANALNGAGGNDRLDGGTGADSMTGGAGNDRFIVDNLGDKATEASATGGTDEVLSTVSFTLGANIETLTLGGAAAIDGTGNVGANILVGNKGANLLNGAGGADTMTGGGGSDRYLVNSVGDKVVEGAGGGVDSVTSTVTFTLAANVEHLTLAGTGAIGGTGNKAANLMTGNGAANKLSGLGGADTLIGGGGGDTLDGGGGADKLFGGAGKDKLTGGSGTDGFHFDAPLSARFNVDQILDFSRADDTIFLDRDVFTGIAATGALIAGAFRLGTAAADANDRILYDQASGKIFYDADGAGGVAAVLFAQVSAGTTLTNADFVGYI